MRSPNNLHPTSMALQARDVPVNPVGEDLYTVLHNYSASKLSTFLHNEMVYMIGNSAGVFLSGLTFTLGISSILLLSSKRPLSKQDTLLRAYTIILLFLVTSFQTVALFTTFLPFISLSHSYDKKIGDETKSGVVFNVTLAVTAGLTDGLMVSTRPYFYSYFVLTTTFQGLEMFYGSKSTE